MSLLKIERDGGLVCLSHQQGQNENVIRGVGGFCVTQSQQASHPTTRGHSTREYVRYVAVGSVVWLHAACVTWSRRVG